MDDQPSVLIIARPAQLRNSLRVLVAGSALVKSIHLAVDFRGAAKPALVILASDQETGDIQSVLDQMKQAWPDTPVIALVDSEAAFTGVMAAGAEAVLVKGIRAAHLLQVVESLLQEQ